VIATAVSSVVTNGTAAGCRAIDLRVEGGIDLRLLPDRGLDAGDAWYAGVPLDWRSPVGETGNVANDWMLSFGGGLMVTCGLRNVGVPSEGHGQHGDYTFQRAHVEAVERSGDALIVQGTISEVAALGHNLHVARTWRTYAGQGLVQLEDVVTNRGHATEPALQLYHVNLGPRLWAEGASLSIDARATHPRDADAAAFAFAGAWRDAPAVMPDAPERVYEHEVTPGADGWCSATVTHGQLELEVRWDTATMPRMWQWVHPSYGVLGLEPANCSVLGVAHDRAEGRLPELAPGEERRTRLEIRARAR
jgi:Domain of unknown function (DUF4432)